MRKYILKFLRLYFLVSSSETFPMHCYVPDECKYALLMQRDKKIKQSVVTDMTNERQAR